MPKVYKVEKARKARPAHGIAVGDTYYWWKFRFGGKRYSKTYPKPQQLTQSEYLITVYDAQDTFAEICRLNETGKVSDVKDDLTALAEQVRDIAATCEERLCNMPEALQYAPTGELLQERADMANDAADYIEQAIAGYEPEDPASDLLSEVEGHMSEITP